MWAAFATLASGVLSGKAAVDAAKYQNKLLQAQYALAASQPAAAAYGPVTVAMPQRSSTSSSSSGASWAPLALLGGGLLLIALLVRR